MLWVCIAMLYFEMHAEAGIIRGLPKSVRVFENDLCGQQLNLETNCFIANPSVLTLT